MMSEEGTQPEKFFARGVSALANSSRVVAQPNSDLSLAKVAEVPDLGNAVVVQLIYKPRLLVKLSVPN